ncbi:MAG: hypothetical protein ACRCYO_11460, partial [Bacteroidia bacterium]
MRYLIIPVLLLVFLTACDGAKKKTKTDDLTKAEQPAVEQFALGVLSETSCVSDPSNRYAIYLPKSLDTSKPRRVIVFFDPHADGQLPLTKYQNLAEKHGYVLVGSNVIQNGMMMTDVTFIGNTLLNDLSRLFVLDSTRLLLCGFSGGARSASAIAASRSDVRGLIACSASPGTPLVTKGIVGIAGLGDMNYSEVESFMDRLPDAQAPQELLLFDGKHEWPPLEIMDAAWTILRAYHPGMPFDANDSATADAYGDWALEQANLQIGTDCMRAQQTLIPAVNCLKNYGGAATLNDALQRLQKNACLKKSIVAHDRMAQEEKKLQQEIRENLMQQDTTWWNLNADSYFKSEKDELDLLMRQRLQGFASLMCYSYAGQALKVANLRAAEKMINLYRIVDPQNSEWAYLRASLYMRLQLPDLALQDLEKAILLGFKDRKRLEADEVF